VIECNLRASRSFPFVSKILKENFIDYAIRAMLGEKVDCPSKSAFEFDFVGVKAPQFSFSRLKGADPLLGVEMASTGEVACLGDNVEEAYLKALISVGFKLPKIGVLLSTGTIESKAAFLESWSNSASLSLQLPTLIYFLNRMTSIPRCYISLWTRNLPVSSRRSRRA
jgi:carbamoyl-phosphate synthase large subunit